MAVRPLAPRGGRRQRRQGGAAGAAVCSLALPAAPRGGWRGPRLRLALPSFSGATPEHPGLLRYACQLAARIRVSPAVRVQARAALARRALAAHVRHVLYGRTRFVQPAERDDAPDS